MSLVDYGSSSDDDVPDNIEEEEEKQKQQHQPLQESKPQIETQAPMPQNNQSSGPSLPEQQEVAEPSPQSLSKLPDASLLLDSPIGGLVSSVSDHASLVSAAMAENASRKRELKLASPSRSSKLARGNLVPDKNVPDTSGGLLVPPQLKGRSNIVTEDIGKLFVRRRIEPSSH